MKEKAAGLSGASDLGRTRGMELALLVTLLLLATLLTMPSLGAYIIWGDEAGLLLMSGVFEPPFAPEEVIESVASYANDQMPLYYLLGAGWAAIAGFSAFALRYLSLICGLLMIAWLYRLACDALGRRAALVASILMATNAFVLVYFHELKMYTLLLLLAVAHIWFYWRLIRQGRASRLIWLAFFLTTTASLYTHNLSFFLFAALLAHHLVFERGNRRFLSVMIGWVAGAILFLPYLGNTLAGSFARGSMTEAIAISDLMATASHVMLNGQHILWLPLILCLAYALKRRPSPVKGRFLLIAMVLSALLLAVGLRFHLLQVKTMRYLLLCWIPFTLICGWALTSLPHARWLTGAFLLIWIGAGIHLTLSGEIMEYAGYKVWAQRFPPLHRYLPLLRDKVKSGDYLLGFTIDDEISEDIKRGYDGSIGDYYLKARLGIDGMFLRASERKYRLKRDVGDLTRARPHILLAHDPSDPPRNYAPTRFFLEEAFEACPALVDEAWLRIVKYRHPVLACDHAPAAAVEYANGMRLIDRAVEHDPASGLFRVLLWWDIPEESMLDDYNISLQLFAFDGDKVAQVDRHLDQQLVPWSVVDFDISDVPAGDYEMMLIVYKRDGGAKVAGFEEGEAAVKLVRLLSLEIDAA